MENFFTPREFFQHPICFIWPIATGATNYFGMSIQKVHQKIFNRFFSGRSIASVEAEVKLFLDRHFDSMINQSVKERLLHYQNRKDHVFILSSSPHFIVGPIAERFGVLQWEATQYGVDKDHRLCNIAKLIEGWEKAVSVKRIAER